METMKTVLRGKSFSFFMKVEIWEILFSCYTRDLFKFSTDPLATIDESYP